MASFAPAGETGLQKGTNSAGAVCSRFDPFPKRRSKGAFPGQFPRVSPDRPFRSVTLSKVAKGTFTLDFPQFLPWPVPVPRSAGLPLLAAALVLMGAAPSAREPRRQPAWALLARHRLRGMDFTDHQWRKGVSRFGRIGR
jgi:hypothetical protein